MFDSNNFHNKAENNTVNNTGLQIFNYTGKEVRIVQKDGEPWFVAKDVCEILEIGNTSQALTRLDEDEKADIILNDSSQNRTFLVVSESGLYSLILSSRKPEAKQFKRWITHELIPSIRKHGVYATENFIEQAINDPDFAIKTLQALKEEREARRLAEQILAEQAPMVEGYNTFLNINDSITMEDFAKTVADRLKKPIGRNKMFKILRERQALTRDNRPSQSMINRGLMKEKMTIYTDIDGEEHIRYQTLLTLKGCEYVFKRLIELGEIQEKEVI